MKRNKAESSTPKKRNKSKKVTQTLTSSSIITDDFEKEKQAISLKEKKLELEEKELKLEKERLILEKEKLEIIKLKRELGLTE